MAAERNVIDGHHIYIVQGASGAVAVNTRRAGMSLLTNWRSALYTAQYIPT